MLRVFARSTRKVRKRPITRVLGGSKIDGAWVNGSTNGLFCTLSGTTDQLLAAATPRPRL